MNENFDPNRTVDGSSILGSFGKANVDNTAGAAVSANGGDERSGDALGAVADTNAPLIAVLRGLEDGQVAVMGDLVAIRAGPETYHPIKALKVIPKGCKMVRPNHSNRRWVF